jgi:hypothetical protein
MNLPPKCERCLRRYSSEEQSFSRTAFQETGAGSIPLPASRQFDFEGPGFSAERHVSR